ncbi:MAG: molybdopterin-synthase adenylyltransferase MoeB [Thermoplasmata archaeon]|nr:molybdopterin-synthase adenylyltransferase MoeB [Thermoplasmata archaeon]
MARTTVKLPAPLRALAGGSGEVFLVGETVGAVVRELAERYPPLRRHLFAQGGELRNYVTVYVNDRDIRELERAETTLKEGDVVSIVPSIAGGAAPSEDGPEIPPTSVAEVPFSREELIRYSRHLLLPEIGLAGQKKLRASRVLIVGAGGLGSPAALYLAAAGVGVIGLVDFDRVEASNLQRQILYSTADVGRPKLEAAGARVIGLNPGVRLVSHEERLTSGNALEILGAYDLVIDGTDNFPTRYLVNDACVLLGKPNVYGSIYRFEGQASVFDSRVGPCYRCLFPEPPPPDLVPSCAEAGVLGVLPGLVGTIQATEAIKLLLHLGESLVGRLLLYDASEMRFRELPIRKNPECILCSEHATQKGLIDYAEFCGVPGAIVETRAGTVPEISPTALRDELASSDPPLLVDVRDPEEWDISQIGGARRIPRALLPEKVDELTGAREIVLFCRSGKRSALAAQLLIDLGFSHVKSLAGGINAWADEVDPSLVKY